MANQELLEKVLGEITSKPQNWNQGGWLSGRAVEDVPASMVPKIEEGAVAACGTTACLAGHAMIQSGEFEPVITYVHVDEDEKPDSFEVDFRHVATGEMIEDYADELMENVVPADDYRQLAEDRFVYFGSKALGISFDLGRRLFYRTEVDHDDPQGFTDWVRREIATDEVSA